MPRIEVEEMPFAKAIEQYPAAVPWFVDSAHVTAQVSPDGNTRFPSAREVIFAAGAEEPLLDIFHPELSAGHYGAFTLFVAERSPMVPYEVHRGFKIIDAPTTEQTPLKIYEAATHLTRRRLMRPTTDLIVQLLKNPEDPGMVWVYPQPGFQATPEGSDFLEQVRTTPDNGQLLQRLHTSRRMRRPSSRQRPAVRRG